MVRTHTVTTTVTKKSSPSRQGKLQKTTTVEESTKRRYEPLPSPKKKIVKRTGTRSPTKRLMQMKNAQARTQNQTAGQRDGSNILYNVKPGTAYLVSKEDVSTLSKKQREERADQIMDDHNTSITKSVKKKSKK